MPPIDSVSLRIVNDIANVWHYDDWFLPHDKFSDSGVFDQANQIQEQAGIERHRFFDMARVERDALKLWASQEAVVTGPFSQFLLLVASQLENVHLRAQFLEVATGEHNRLKKSQAPNSHPWLLHRLCSSMGINGADVSPAHATIEFLTALASATSNTMRALGALGVGNERMLIPEYTAVKVCFEHCYPEADYRGFLMANIAEDAEHTRIIENVARMLARQGHDENEYLIGAQLGVEARVLYYDNLLSYYMSSKS